MTYEEYKKTNEPKKINIVRLVLEKLFTITIFTMIIITTSNTNESFRNFLINDVLNNTMDFSKVNNLLDKFTNNVNDNSQQVFNEIEKSEIYEDGYKYKTNINQEIKLKDSGIVTYIGDKEKYGNTIVIQQSNGYYAWYSNIEENIKLYDYIEKDEVIGKTISNYYYYTLFKDNKPITHEN